jgi:hypothetical protein
MKLFPKRFLERAGRLAGLLTLLMAPLAFANEFTLQGAMETVFVPLQVQIDGNERTAAETGLGVFGYSRNGGARFKLMSNASLERIGMISYLRFYTSTATDSRLDTIWLGTWVKPTDWLRFDVGSLEDWTLWGKFGQPRFAPYTQRTGDEDSIFTEFYYPSGALVTVRPNDNLFIGVGVPLLKSNNGDKPNSYQPSYLINAEDAEKTYERVQAAVGYTIDGVGLVRFQYVGANPKATVTTTDGISLVTVNSHAKIEGAFAYNGVSGLLIDAGFKIPVKFEQDGGEFLAPYQISGGFRVNSGNLTFEGRVDSKFGGEVKVDADSDNKSKIAPEIGVHLTPSYTIDTLVIGLDGGLEWYGENTNQDGNIINGRSGGTRGGIGAFVQKNFGPGSYITGGITYHFGGTMDSVKQTSSFTIPIMFNYTSPKVSLLKE